MKKYIEGAPIFIKFHEGLAGESAHLCGLLRWRGKWRCAIPNLNHYATDNILFQPWTSCPFGIEYVYGSLEGKDGFRWVAPRIQASITY